MLRTMQTALLTLVIVAANLLGGFMAVPQARHVLRSRNTSGVSLVWAAMSATVNAWWLAYGVAIGNLAILPVSVVSVTVYLVIAWSVVRMSAQPSGRRVAAALGAAAAVSIVPLAAVVIVGWLTAGVVLGALYGVQLAPAVISAYRSTDVSGVSGTPWTIALAAAALWGVYGVAGRDAGIVTLSATGVLMSTLVLVRLAARRPRRDGDRLVAGSVGLAPA